MLKLNARLFVNLFNLLGTVGHTPGGKDPNIKYSELDAEYTKIIAGILTSVVETCNELELTGSSVRALRIRKSFADSTEVELARQVSELQQVIEDELQGKFLFYLEQKKIYYYVKSIERLGNCNAADIHKSIFTEIQYDLDAANRCYALDCSSACAFHLMRIVEAGLMALAAALSIQFNKHNKTWEAILAPLAAKIDRKNGTRIRVIIDNQVAFERALDDLRGFQGAWRNPTMHFDQNYDEREAHNMLIRCGGFIEHLSKVLQLFP